MRRKKNVESKSLTPKINEEVLKKSTTLQQSTKRCMLKQCVDAAAVTFASVAKKPTSPKVLKLWLKLNAVLLNSKYMKVCAL